MSAAATADAAPPAKGKKKLVMIIAAVVLLAVVGGGAMLMLKKKPAEEGEEGADAGAHKPAAAAAVKHDAHNPPVFVPLEPFTVNLADRDADHYAQVGITLEIDDAKTGEQIKTFMPAIRNNILMAIADRTAAELMGREGKTRLADRLKRETAKALGYDIDDDEDADAHGDADDDKPKKKKKKKKKAEPALPVKAVHFSNFIIQ